MLNRNERLVMSAIYDKCLGTGSCLVTIDELIELIPRKRKLDKEKAEAVVRSLELDDYFDVVFSDRKGEPVLCINLHSKGQLYQRETVMLRRAVLNRLMLAGVSAVATFVIGRILLYFFS